MPDEYMYLKSINQPKIFSRTALNPFLNDKFINQSKQKELVDDNFEFDENGRWFSKRVEDNCGKRRNCSFRAISPFPAVFSKDLYCRHVKTRAYLGKC